MSDHERLEAFLGLSRLLLELDELDSRAGAVYLAMLDDLDAVWPLDAMAHGLLPLAHLPADERERRIIDALDDHPPWHAATVDLLQVWYTGSLNRPDSQPVTQPPQAYLGALVWTLLDTQAPGLPGPFFGEWAYPPTRAGSPAWSDDRG
jgi:hypothetical protein